MSCLQRLDALEANKWTNMQLRTAELPAASMSSSDGTQHSKRAPCHREHGVARRAGCTLSRVGALSRVGTLSRVGALLRDYGISCSSTPDAYNLFALIMYSWWLYWFYS